VGPEVGPVEGEESPLVPDGSDAGLLGLENCPLDVQ
jgi:hypothetical protein